MGQSCPLDVDSIQWESDETKEGWIQLTEVTLNHDAVTQMLFNQINEGIDKINKANETLLAEEEQGAGLREIDSALKDLFKGSEFDDEGNLTVVPEEDKREIVLAWKAAEDARAAFKSAVDNARNLYRSEVLGEEAKAATEEVDKDAVKNERKLVLEAVSLLKTYAGANGKKDVVGWAEHLEIPQVGRAGVSVVGQKKPRAYVSVNGTVHESFGEAAKAASVLLSNDTEKVSVTSGDLVTAWTENGERDNFEYNGLEVKVELKKKASES